MDLQAAAILQEEGEFSSAHQVFEIPHLLEKILDLAMYDGNKVQMETVKTCKFVSKHWLATVCDLFQKNTDIPPRLLFPCKIASFCETFQDSPDNQIRPYILFLHLPNDCVFLSSLYLIGAGMVDLEITVDCDTCNFPKLSKLVKIISEPLQLPRLKSVNVDFQSPPEHNVAEMHRSVLTLLQAILRGSESLESVEIANESDDIIAGPEFQLQLPNSVTRVKLFGELRVSDLTSVLLGNNALPNLSSLEIPFKRYFTNDFSDILQHYRQQLKQLVIEGEFYEPPSIISLPVLECLEQFTCTKFLLPNADYPRCFPELKKIMLYGQTVDSLCHWFQRIRYPKVEEVQIHRQGAISNRDSDAMVMELCHQITTAFPIVTKLELDIDFTRQMSYFKLIFRRMRQLLSLKVFVANCPNDLNHHIFNGVCIGISPVEAATLEDEQRILNYDELDSIVHLTELTKLKIYAYQHNNIQLISELAFEYAFFKMPKFRKLEFSRESVFEPSPEFAQRLIDHYITLETSNYFY